VGAGGACLRERETETRECHGACEAGVGVVCTARQACAGCIASRGRKGMCARVVGVLGETRVASRSGEAGRGWAERVLKVRALKERLAC
jgi:hypothetical protein